MPDDPAREKPPAGDKAEPPPESPEEMLGDDDVVSDMSLVDKFDVNRYLASLLHEMVEEEDGAEPNRSRRRILGQLVFKHAFAVRSRYPF